MLLLDFMVELSHELGLRLAVVHFNHLLRAEESDADERFVRKRAQDLGLDFIAGRAETIRVAREQRKNLEATARDLRYRFFFGLVRQGRVDKVATAHTANDQAETVLLRLLRGAGTRGLGGIHPALDGGVVRPFLGLTRAQVESEVARRQLPFRTDSTNADTRFARNRIRHGLMPLMERDFNPDIASALSAFAERARDDEAFMEAHARERSRPWIVSEAGALKIAVQRLNELPPAIARRVLRQMLAEAAKLRMDDCRLMIGSSSSGLGNRQSQTGNVQAAIGRAPSYTDIECIRRLAREGQSGKRFLLGAFEARKEFEWLVVSRVSQTGAPPGAGPGFAHEIRPPAQVSIPELGIRLQFRLVEKMDANLPQGGYTGGVWLEAGNLRAPLILRNFRPGDRVYISGHGRPVKLKEIFQRRRIPREQRPCWPVLESQGKIIWTRGLEMPVEPRNGLEPAGERLMVIEERTVSGSTSGNRQ